jgi:hypothetical protein
MPRKIETKETVKIEEQPEEVQVAAKPKVPDHNHSFYHYASDEAFDYWKCSMSSCGFIEKRPRTVAAVREKEKPKKFSGKTYEVQYNCRNCGSRFKVRFPFNMKATDTEPCFKCGIDDSRKFIRKEK